MKQPENRIAVEDRAGDFAVELEEREFPHFYNNMDLAIGKTKSSALKAAKRRLQRLIRDIERMENE